MQIQAYKPHHLEAVIGLSLRAWTPVFDALQSLMNADVYRSFYPNQWQVSQQKSVEGACTAEDTHVWVAVDPDFQGHGIGSALIEFALAQMKDAGMILAMVETAGDPVHAPARHTYEKAGFELFPVARYYKVL